MKAETRYPLVGLLLILLVLSGAMLALAGGGFNYSELSPRNGATVRSPDTTIRASVTADANIVANSAQITINGETYNATFTEWFTPKDGEIKYNAKNLADGMYNVEFSLEDVNGDVGKRAWQFTVAVPPVISELQPKDKSAHRTVDLIGAKAVDPNGTVESVVLKVNGEAVDADFDAETGYVSYEPGDLPDGENTVTLTATDNSGLSTTRNWSFTTDNTPPAFSNVVPADGAVLENGPPKVSVRIVDEQSVLVEDSIKMFINGEVVAATLEFDYDLWTQKYDKQKATLTYPITSLPHGTVEVRVEANDAAGNEGVLTWEFTIASLPKILEIHPAPNTAITSKRPIITIDVFSSEALTQDSVTLKTKGSVVGTEWTELGDNKYRVTYQPQNEWMLDEEVTLEFTAENSAGQSVTKEWYYLVDVFGDMPGTGDVSGCVHCHDNAEIKGRLCGDCHGYDIDDWHSTCFDCHSPDSVYFPGGHYGYTFGSYPHDMTEDHLVNPEELIGCRGCHSKVLTREHNRKDYTCGTCHAHESETIMDAIAEGRRDCFACHTGEAAGQVHPPHEVTYGEVCGECHGYDMMTEKVEHNDNCSGCHASDNQVYQEAILYNKGSCFDCHETPHGVYMATVPEDVFLYGNVSWGTPQNAEIFSGEAWLPAQLDNSAGRVLFSSRATLDASGLYGLYQSQMEDAGWTLLDSSLDGDGFTLEFKKRNRYCTVWLYSGDVPGGEGSNPAGSRLKVAYH
ncbi:hypothetical protein [Dethiobacter alkaliphilus]|uniref:Uncharacterized protein n=1 Tax=Dethiobacter alkaliphilus AHT 1 TaxID=555088 RepID=C0GG32_DETAL|nr:hypothetical protein [Dethiobacter alkaliphilus]EEG77721.1 hypothetical protein DealDRAFT_1441 [Dethiobacter alkaliphilus AHT 1]